MKVYWETLDNICPFVSHFHYIAIPKIHTIADVQFQRKFEKQTRSQNQCRMRFCSFLPSQNDPNRHREQQNKITRKPSFPIASQRVDVSVFYTECSRLGTEMPQGEMGIHNHSLLPLWLSAQQDQKPMGINRTRTYILVYIYIYRNARI